VTGWATISGALALGTVGLQIAYPLATDAGRRTLSIVTVGTFAAASTADAVGVGGPRAGLALLACGAGIGGLAEIVGVHTGRPFGRYCYAGTLGPQPFGVPIVVPLAWTMAAWPAWRVAGLLPRPTGRTPRGARVVRWLAAAWALASWDLFLDPQMVAAGHWQWLHPTPALPGVPGIPISNFVGWLGVSLAVTGALELTVGAPPTTRIGPTVGLLAGWTWVGGIVANAAFFRRPGVALAGGLAMGVVALPALRTVMGRRRR
jgi:uncharacterized membrane protein